MAIVIVNHNTREQLAACLDTIQEDARREVIVVDNASCDGSAEMVQGVYPWATLVANQTNPGYGAGANQGIAYCNAGYVLVLNSDTRLEPRSVQALSQYLDQHEEVAIVGPRLANLDGTLQASCYPLPTPRNIFIEESGLLRALRAVPVLRNAYLRTWPHNKSRAVPWVLGAVLAIRRTAFEDVSGFDESFFMYYEEADLCYRLSDAGWQVHFAPVTTITHIGGASTIKQHADMLVQVYTSVRRFYHRHYSRFQLIQLYLVINAVIVGRLIRDSAHFRRTKDPDKRKRIVEDVSAWLRVLSYEGDVNTQDVARRSAAKERSRFDAKPQLRQADWRFLLPTPPSGSFEHMVLLCESDLEGLAERLVEMNVARQVSCTIPPRCSADALVILGGNISRARLRRAIRSLMPTGVMYCEIDRRWSPRRLLATPASTARLLRERSMSSIALYWTAPSLARSDRYIPLDVESPMRWYVTTLCMSGTWTQRIWELGIDILARFGSRWLTGLVPWYAVTAIAAPDADAVPSIFVHADSLIGRRLPGVSPALLTSGQDDGSRVVVLPFVAGRSQPECVIKVARRPDFNINVEHEQRILGEIRERLDSSMRATIPEPLGLIHFGEVAVGAESYAPGPSLFVSTGRWGASNREKIGDLRVATCWLARFNQQVQLSPLESGASVFVQRAETLFARYSRTFDATTNEQRLFSTVLDRARALIDAPLPTVWQHNDFGPWNVHRTKDELHVIDWELGWGPGFDHAGPALSDLLYFVTHWSFAAHQLHTPTSWVEGLHQLFVVCDDRDELIVAAHQVIDEYLTNLGIDRQFLPLILVFTWVERALKRFDRRHLLGDLPIPVRSDDKFASYVSCLGDHITQIFNSSRYASQVSHYSNSVALPRSSGI